MSAPIHTAHEATQMLASGERTAVALTHYYLGRIERLNPDLNAVLALDVGGAEAAARASDERRSRGASLSPLDGVPVLIKDNIEAAGLPCSAGSRALLDSPPTADAPLVTNLRQAGLIILGATNLSEWANFRSTASTSGWSAVGGQTNNPYELSRNTSGSSAGSAVAVSAALVPLAVGTETDGSIVSPAGVCGVVGFKPTIGTIPGAGIVPISRRQDTAGPLARTVADAAALFAVLAGRPVVLPPLPLAGLPVAVWRPDGLSRPIADVLAGCLDRLAAAGCELVEGHGAKLGPFDDAEFDALVAEFAAELPAYLAARPGPHPRTWDQLLAFNRADDVELSKFSDEIFALAERAPSLASESYRAARAEADAAAANGLQGALAGCDVVIVPTNSAAEITRYGLAEHPGVSTSSLSAVTGSPSISIPAGLVEGLPIGVSILGRRDQDELVLSFAAALEALLPVRIDPPIAAAF